MKNIKETRIILDTETTGLDPMKDELVAIGVIIEGKQIIFLRGKADPEIELLQQFWEIVSMQENPVIIGFNTTFDWQFLKLRSLLHRVKFQWFDKYTNMKDLRLMLDSDKYKKGTTLTDYCIFLSIPDCDKHDGSEVPLLWEEGRTDEIGEHLDHDLKKTHRLYELISGCVE